MRKSGDVVGRGHHELPELRPDLKEDMSPAASVVGAENLGLFLVHLQILSEDWLSGKNPSPAPVPPSLNGPAGVLPHGGDGLGPLHGPCGRRG